VVAHMWSSDGEGTFSTQLPEPGCLEEVGEPVTWVSGGGRNRTRTCDLTRVNEASEHQFSATVLDG